MLIEFFNARCVLLAACLMACSQLAAFEPGSERTCEPSADGERFVCRDASGAEVEAPAESVESTSTPAAAPLPAETPQPVAATEPASTPKTEAAPTSDEPPASDSVPSSTSKLPNYLFQNPGSASRPARTSTTSAPAVRPAPAPAPAPAPEPVPSSVSEAPKPPAQPAAAERPQPAREAAPVSVPKAKPAATAAAAPTDAPATPAATPAASQTSTAANMTPSPKPVEPAPLKSPSTPASSKAAAVGRTPAATGAAEAVPRAEPATSSTPGSRRPVSSAREFMSLPGSHFTLVLDSARTTAELNGLIDALENLPGNLYLVALEMPDGRWYSVCWSDFDSLDAARAARAGLPADAPIASGWPRRISLLQSEIK